MILSHADIEEIAAAVIIDFHQTVTEPKRSTKCPMPKCTSIDFLASQYLKLQVSYTELSDDGSLCGITAYTDTSYQITVNGIEKNIPLKQNQVLLDTSLLGRDQDKITRGKRNFTLAHECAHQILFQLESDEVKLAFKRSYAERRSYSLRELKTREDWNEWQANALGAALLMPTQELDLAIWRFAFGRQLINYDGYFTHMDRHALNGMSEAFKVSKTALIIRLRHLGYLIDRPYSEFNDPLEVYACEDLL